MKFKFLNIILAGLLLLTVTVTNAGIITDTNNDSFIDETTGLEWLDFGINNGQGFNYVTSQFHIGGEYEGWSLATEKQVYELWNNAFFSNNPEIFVEHHETHLGPYALEYTPDVETTSTLWDISFQAMSYNYINFEYLDHEYQGAQGLFIDDNGLFAQAVLKNYTNPQRYSSFEGTDHATISHICAINSDPENCNRVFRDSIQVDHATLLVRAFSVPEPSTLAIFTLGLIGLASRKFKK